MDRDKALTLLRIHKPVLAHRFGVVDMAPFRGSVLSGISAGRPVDLITNKVLRLELRPYVEKEAVHVY